MIHGFGKNSDTFKTTSLGNMSVLVISVLGLWNWKDLTLNLRFAVL